MRPALYEIRFDGTLGPEDLEEFAGMTARVDGRCTVLRGLIRDQPELVGAVARVEALGCTVREVRAVDPAADAEPGSRR